MQDLLESLVIEVSNVDVLYIVGKYQIAYQNSCDVFAVSVQTFDDKCVVRKETSIHNEFAVETIKLLRERVEHLCSFLHRNSTVRDLPPSVDTWGILSLKSMTEYNRLCTLTWDKATEVMMNDAMFERSCWSLLKRQ